MHTYTCVCVYWFVSFRCMFCACVCLLCCCVVLFNVSVVVVFVFFAAVEGPRVALLV